MENDLASMNRAPVNRAMRQLDRSFFHKKIPLAAARILDTKQITKCKGDLSKELLSLERCSIVRPDPDDAGSSMGRKALLLRPDIRPDGRPRNQLSHVQYVSSIANGVQMRRHGPQCYISLLRRRWSLLRLMNWT